MEKTYIDLTGEAILNPKALPSYMEGWMRYRVEYWEPGQHYPDERGYLYLPPEADVVEVINAMNGYELYKPLKRRGRWISRIRARMKL